MKKLSILAAGLMAAFAANADTYLDRETTSFQPGLNAGANAAKRTGDGFFGGVIYNNYRANPTDANGAISGAPVDVYTLFNVLNYNTTWEVLGAKYSLGAIVPVGEIHSSAGGSNLSSGIEVGEPVLMPAQLYWEGDKLNVTARWFYRATSTKSVLDKPYETHQLMTAATYDVNDRWQLNGALAYEMRGKHSNANLDLKPGNILTLDGSVVRKFEGGYSVGLLGYHMSNDTLDSGRGEVKTVAGEKRLVHPNGGTLTGYGVEIAAPVSMQSGVSLRVFNEMNSKTSTQGTRMFLSYGYQF